MTNFIFGNQSPVAEFKNKIINGDFRLWQRGTSFNSSAIYSSDRFLINSGGLAAGDVVTRESFVPGQTEVPGNPEFFYKFTFGGNVSNKVMSQRIEDVTLFSGKLVTVSYWAKSSSNLTNTFEYSQFFGPGGSSQVNIAPVNMSVTSTWQKFSHTFDVPSVSGKTITAGNYINLPIIRIINESSNSISIANVQVEEGPVATEFEQRPLTIETKLAERYYEKGVEYVYSARVQSIAVIPFSFNYNTRKRVIPTFVLGSWTGNRSGVGPVTLPSSFQSSFPTEDGTAFEVVGDGSVIAAYSGTYGYSADAEL